MNLDVLQYFKYLTAREYVVIAFSQCLLIKNAILDISLTVLVFVLRKLSSVSTLG